MDNYSCRDSNWPSLNLNIIQKWKDYNQITFFQGQFSCTYSDGQGLSGGGATGQLGGLTSAYCGSVTLIGIIQKNDSNAIANDASKVDGGIMDQMTVVGLATDCGNILAKDLWAHRFIFKQCISQRKYHIFVR